MQSTCPSEHGMITSLHYNSSFCGTSISGTDASAGGLLLAGCESGVVLSFDIRTGLRYWPKYIYTRLTLLITLCTESFVKPLVIRNP